MHVTSLRVSDLHGWGSSAADVLPALRPRLRNRALPSWHCLSSEDLFCCVEKCCRTGGALGEGHGRNTATPKLSNSETVRRGFGSDSGKVTPGRASSAKARLTASAPPTAVR